MKNRDSFFSGVGPFFGFIAGFSYMLVDRKVSLSVKSRSMSSWPLVCNGPVTQDVCIQVIVIRCQVSYSTRVMHMLAELGGVKPLPLVNMPRAQSLQCHSVLSIM